MDAEAELLLAGYLVLSCKRGTPLTIMLPATIACFQVHVVTTGTALLSTDQVPNKGLKEGKKKKNH